MKKIKGIYVVLSLLLTCLLFLVGCTEDYARYEYEKGYEKYLESNPTIDTSNWGQYYIDDGWEERLEEQQEKAKIDAGIIY